MHTAIRIFAMGFVIVASALPSFAQDTTEPSPVAFDPTGVFIDSFGTSFSFSLCGEAGTDLCAVLTTLEGESATEENLAFVGTQVIQAVQSAPNQWKGSLNAGGISAEATVTMVGPDTIEVQGCRAAILCQTLSYVRNGELISGHADRKPQAQ